MADLKYGSWDEAYNELKKLGVDDSKIVASLERKGYTRDMKPKDETPTVQNTPHLDVVEGGTYDEIKAKEGEKAFDDLANTEKSDNEDEGGINRGTVLGGTGLTLQAITPFIQKYGAKAVRDAIKKGGSKGLSLLKTGAGKVLGAAGVLLDEGQALYNENEDIKKGNISSAGQGALYNIDKMLFDAIPDKLYYNKGEKKEQAKNNVKAANTYKKLGGNALSNLTGIKSLEGGYLKEENKINKTYGADEAMKANNQVSRAAASLGVDVTDLKADLAKKGFTYKKDKNGNLTWVNKDGLTLQNAVNEYKKA